MRLKTCTIRITAAAGTNLAGAYFSMYRHYIPWRTSGLRRNMHLHPTTETCSIARECIVKDSLLLPYQCSGAVSSPLWQGTRQSLLGILGCG